MVSKEKRQKNEENTSQSLVTQTKPKRFNNLNLKYTFENFIVGSNNEFAKTASESVSNNPGEQNFNPLIIYGGVGLGKTHLMHAIGNRALEKNNDIIVGDIDFSKKSKWSAKLSTKYGVKVSPMLGSKVNNKTNGNALIFLGNKKGKSTETDGARYITTKPMDIRKGGVISFYLKDGPDDGDYGCLATMEEYRRKEAARIARMQNETIAKEKCANKPPCGGHGEGIYTSSCFKKGRT